MVSFTRKFLFGMMILLWSNYLMALNCQQVRQLTFYYFKNHFSKNAFDDELSERTLENYIKAWDPGKVYFLNSDVEEFRRNYASNIDDMVKKNDCSVIMSVADRYSKRFQERQVTIAKQIKADHDFSKDEYLVIDRKKLNFAKTTEEVEDRWRKRIKFQLLQLKDTVKSIDKAKEKLEKRYTLARKRHNETTSDDVYSLFLNAFATGLDPHSDYLAAEQLEDFRIKTKLSLEGIGAVLRSEDGFTTIQSLVPGGAAFKTGKVKVDDKIIMVGQADQPPVDVIDMELREVVKLIRGTRGTEVRLTLVREAGGKTQQVVVPIIREKIQLKDQAAKSFVHEVKVNGKESRDLKIGVIELPSFYMDFEGRQNRVSNFRSSSADMKREIESLNKQGIDGLIVDLRSNGGGSLDESINIAGLFFDKGPVVQIRDPRGRTYVQEDTDGKTFYSGPLVVMINRHSASASEILAGAIQDYQRGIIVGDSHTFGKGTVQNLNDIDERLGAIKVTISKFYRPSGSSTQLKGVEADIVFPSLFDQYDVGEKYYDYALPWEKIPTSKFQNFRQVSSHLKDVSKRSQQRVAKDKKFDDVRKAISEYKENEEERSRVKISESKDDKDKNETDEDEEVAETDGHDLSKDIYLQEALRVTADYVQSLNKKPFGDLVLPELKQVSIVDKGAAKKQSKKND